MSHTDLQIHITHRDYHKVILLDHNLSEDIFKFNTSKCVADFNCQCNIKLKYRFICF